MSSLEKDQDYLENILKQLSEEIFKEEIILVYNKKSYKNKLISEYQIDLLFPTNIEEENYEFILEINLTDKKIHLFSKNLPFITDFRDLLPIISPCPNDILFLKERNFFDLVNDIQNFLEKVPEVNFSLGRFYLGEQYDLNIVNSIKDLIRIPCHRIDKIDGEDKEIFSLCCLSDEFLFLFEYNEIISNSNLNFDLNNDLFDKNNYYNNKILLIFYSSFRNLVSCKKTFDSNNISFIWKKIFNQNKYKNIELIIKFDKEEDIDLINNYLGKKTKNFKTILDIQKYKKGEIPNVDIDKIKKDIYILEIQLENNDNVLVFNKLLSLYEKAVEYYSAVNDSKYLEYKNKVQELLSNEDYSKYLE